MSAAGTVVQVFARSTYGQVRIYPANPCANLFCDLTKKCTLDPRDLAIMRTLGFTVEQVPDPQAVVI